MMHPSENTATNKADTPTLRCEPLLSARNLKISFNTHDVVHGVDLQIERGSKVALVGESGSGKTITALSILGLVRGAKVSGQCYFESRDLLKLSDSELRGVRGSEIAMIFQEPMTALNPLFTVGDQIAEVLQLKMAMNSKEAWQKAVDLMHETGIAQASLRARSYPHQLSGGQRQRVMIAMALACRPKLLLADEPTTALDASLRLQILELLERFQSEYGMAVLLITHDLNLVKSFAKQVMVMERGLVVESGDVAEVMSRPQHPYTKRLVDSVPVRDVVDVYEDIASSSGLVGDADLTCVMQAKKLSVHYPIPIEGFRGWFKRGRFTAVSEVSFALRPSQTLGVVGESGSGKSTLALASLGLIKSEGELKVMGQPWGRGQLMRRLRSKVQVVFQDPFSSLSPRMTVFELVGEGLGVHAPELSVHLRRARVLSALADVGLNQEEFTNILERYPHEFSGGQRQRLAIARALILEPRVLVLDEPTSALDVTSQKQVVQLMQGLQRSKGLSYLLITHDMAVIKAMAHQVMVMKDGVVVEDGNVHQVLSYPKDPYTQMLVKASL
jgi:microcin C transport system ATP-binding protein